MTLGLGPHGPAALVLSQPRAGRKLHEVARSLAVAYFMLFIPFTGYPASPPASGLPPSPSSMLVNRTVPNVEPPKTVLEFSASPSVDEFFRARIFAEPLVPVGGNPTADENSDLAASVLGYARRAGPDDFATLTGFLERHPQSPWAAALLTNLGLEYYNTAHYSLAMDAWREAWALAKNASDRKALAVVDRAFGELVLMYARLGRMDDLTNSLKSIGDGPLLGPAAERLVQAREALWNMQNRPEISFRCGPLALRSILVARGALDKASDSEIFNSASTQHGCSLPQVAELSRKIGMNYQMAFRGQGDFVMPAVVHWKVRHYAALLRKVGDLYELEDPTFGNRTWATKAALESETSGYFLIAGGPLPAGWKPVGAREGSAVWGKGMTGSNDPRNITKSDRSTPNVCPMVGVGMAVASIHLMDVNLSLKDRPVGYRPPVGPSVYFTVRYNQRDVFQPANFNYENLGPQWTSDWYSYITDMPSNLLADVNLYVGGGGQRAYTGFDTNTQSFAYQQYDQNLLTRTGPASYQLLMGDGSKLIFAQSDGSIGSTRNIFLTQSIDPQGNAVNLTYDTNICVVAITDAIGQVTTLTYGLSSLTIGSGPDAEYVPADLYKLTKVTDPFGRFATFNYTPQVVNIAYTYFNGQISTRSPGYAWGLDSITDEIGITSRFGYQEYDTDVNQFFTLVSSVVTSLTTPYGTTTFFGGDSGNTRFVEIAYPDGGKERVEYNQSVTTQPLTDPVASVPAGMPTVNSFLRFRNSYYWDRTAYAQAYGDYSKAQIFHFMHTENLASTSGALESQKMPLEGRVWYDYAGQSTPVILSSSTLPAHIGRVLDDGTTQLYTYGYNGFGLVTYAIDPLGRSFSYLYATNGIDLLEMRQTRAGKNELLVKMAYNDQHRPVTITDASAQTTTLAYNPRGQLLSAINPKNEHVAITYDSNGYMLAVDGPLPGTNDGVFVSYDGAGRPRTVTDDSGYSLSYDYDNMDRLTRITFPDATTMQMTYDRLDCIAVTDRAGRQTRFDYDNMRQITKKTDPLGRSVYFDWCRCGSPKSIIDEMGRSTSWTMDVQGRRIAKQHSDGSQVKYGYENNTSRRRQIIDEKQQTINFAYNLDNTLASVGYGNTAISTPNVKFTYDSDYVRVTSMTDGIGTTTYGYFPVAGGSTLGAGKLASINGPFANDTVSYVYDELGRLTQQNDDGSLFTRTFDPAGRVVGVSNALGAFAYGYDSNSVRLNSKTSPNGETMSVSYANNLQDRVLQGISHAIGTTQISQFNYGRDIARGEITSWSQQMAAQPASLFTFNYDAADQLVAATVTNAGVLVNHYSYAYDPAGNRVTELAGGVARTTAFNALNQLSAAAGVAANARTNEWDGHNRLTAVTAGNQRTEFGYSGLNHLAYIRQLQNGTETSFRRFVWRHNRILEERDKSGGTITKRFYPQGVKVLTGPLAGSYFYHRDHLGSITSLTDAAGNVRARYAYDPFGRKTKISGDVDADFGFAGMFWSPEASLAITRFRAYDPELGRWLSRDPLKKAEMRQGPNLYAYVANDPFNKTDPLGLAWEWDLLKAIWRTVPSDNEDDGGPEVDIVGDLLGFTLDYETLSGPLLDVLWEDNPFSKLSVPGIAGPFSLFVGAGVTILTMTDCNTMEGILSLVRQGKGGMANKYADRLMRQIETNP